LSFKIADQEESKEKNEPKPKKDKIDSDEWKVRIESARTSRIPFTDMGDENVKNYEGGLLKNTSMGFKQGVAVNLVYVDMKQAIPSMYSKNPKIFFSPIKPGAEKAAEINELLVNQKWKLLKMKGVVRDGIKSAKLFGVCAFKTFYRMSKNFKKTEWNDTQFNDEVQTERIPLNRLLKDPSATSYSTSWWIGHEVEDTIGNIAKKFRIRKLNEISTVKTTQGTSEIDKEQRAKFKFGRYTEIEDRRSGMMFTMVAGIENKVFDKKPINKDFDSMYDFLTYNDIPDRPNPLSDYIFWKDQLKEVARYRTMLVNHAKKGTAKYKSVGKKLSGDQKTQLVVL